MKILTIRTGILVTSIFLVLIIFLSTVGIKTNKLNNQIQNQLEKVNKDFRIELKDVSIILDPLKFKLNLKTIGTNLKYRNREIQLEKIESNISLKSILSNEFSLKNNDYTLNHTATVFMIDRDGNYRGTIAWGENKNSTIQKIIKLSNY